MNLSAPFVQPAGRHDVARRRAALAGIGAFFVLPVSPLPQVDFPTVSVSASLPGASPETMASSVATPLERRLGGIADVNEMTSTQLARPHADHAAVQSRPRHRRRRARRAGRDQRRPRRSAGDAAHQSHLPQGQSRRSADHDPGAHLEDADAGPDLRRRLEHRPAAAAAGERRRRRASSAAARCRPCASRSSRSRSPVRHQPRRCAHRAQLGEPEPAQGRRSRTARCAISSTPTTTGVAASNYAPLVVAWRNGAAVRLSDVAEVNDSVEDIAHARPVQRRAGGHRHHHAPAGGEHHRDRGRGAGDAAAAAARAAGRRGAGRRLGPHAVDPRVPA